MSGEVQIVGASLEDGFKRHWSKSEKRLPFNTEGNRFKVAEPTGLEPATSDVTGRRSNQLNYDSAFKTAMSKQANSIH
jgi:hypothetical protein